MENEKDFFKTSSEISNRILEILKVAKIELDKLYSTNQRVSDLKVGLVYKNGMYLPLRSVEHRIMIDAYEDQLLGIFIDLITEFAKGEENIFKEFAIRTVAEIGLKDSQIIFGADLTEKEKDNFKTIIMLTDYGFLGFDHPSRLLEYKKLLKEQKYLLSEKQLKLFVELEKYLDNQNNEEYKKQIKKVRKLVDSVRSGLYKKTISPSMFRTENIDTFFSAFSHLIHGNTILLTDLLSTKRPKNRNKLRITWTVFMTGINTIYHVEGFLKRKGIKLEIGNLYQDFDTASKKVARYWDSIEK